MIVGTLRNKILLHVKIVIAGLFLPMCEDRTHIKVVCCHPEANFLENIEINLVCLTTLSTKSVRNSFITLYYYSFVNFIDLLEKMVVKTSLL